MSSDQHFVGLSCLSSHTWNIAEHMQRDLLDRIFYYKTVCGIVYNFDYFTFSTISKYVITSTDSTTL